MMNFWTRRLVLLGAVLLVLVQRPNLAAASCTLATAPTSRWKVESQNGVSWLITPCGHRFFSIGINNVNDDFPVTRNVDVFDSYGPKPDAPKEWVKRTTEQIEAWGFNTIGSFSAPNFPLPFIPDLDLGWRADFLWADPFEPSMARQMDAAARKAVAPYKGSPYRIGYFPDNEVGWWSWPLFAYYLKRPQTNYTKRKLVGVIAAYYHDDWRRFTGDFVVPRTIKSFKQLLETPDVRLRLRPSGNGIRIVERWTGIIAGHYYKLVHNALRKADPGALIFGDRLPGYYDPNAVRAMAPYVDAVATNYNPDTPDGWIAHYYFNGLRELTGDKPVIISEWYFAADENRSGNLNNGTMMTVRTQAERAEGAANAARNFAMAPNIIGIHWFQYYDEPKGGRADGEDYDFGLLDTQGRPYKRLVDDLTAANRSLARIHQAARVQSSEHPAAPIKIPEANIDARKPTLVQWPKNAALVRGMAAPAAPFGDFFLAWSAQGLHLATISMDVYFPGTLAYRKTFPLKDAFQIDLGIGAEGKTRRFAFFVIPMRKVAGMKTFPMRIKVCRIQDGRCAAVPTAVATYFGGGPRIIAEATLPWKALGLSGPPPDKRLRLQLAATAFYRARWMSLDGIAPEKAMEDSARWVNSELVQ